MKKHKAIGLMSGSSLDGLDIVYCEFFYNNNNWEYKVIEAETIAYPEEWLLVLKEAPSLAAEKLVKLNISYGKYLGQQALEFIKKYDIGPNLIGSHGHTVFHNPEAGYTLQIGNGEAIVKESGIPTVCNFRTGDILEGGQGAPLVPIGDELLFSDYDYCLNIGGIANISYNHNEERLAFDVCPANQLLNMLSMQLGMPFDHNGSMAQLGKLDKQLFDELNNHPYYKQPVPKSMSNQLVVETFIPILQNNSSSVEDKLYTVCKHIALQVNNAVHKKNATILITGGGAHNAFLSTAIRMESDGNIVIPDSQLVDFKEALIFAFMGVLKLEGKVNCLASATGARSDSSVGIVYSK